MAYYGSLCLGIIFAGPTRLLKCASTQTRRPVEGVDDFFVEEDFDENNVVLFFLLLVLAYLLPVIDGFD